MWSLTRMPAGRPAGARAIVAAHPRASASMALLHPYVNRIGASLCVRVVPLDGCHAARDAPRHVGPAALPSLGDVEPSPRRDSMRMLDTSGAPDLVLHDPRAADGPSRPDRVRPGAGGAAAVP